MKLLCSFLTAFMTAAMLLLASCSSHNMRAPELASVYSLRGKSSHDVRAALGEPVDRDGDKRYFYFLQEESSHHPDPQPKLYAFIFANDRLAKIELATDRN